MKRAVETNSFFQGLWELPGAIKARLEALDWSAIPYMDIAISLGVGVGAGFLFRRYFQVLVVVGVLAGAVVIWLDYTGFMVVDWRAVATNLGINLNTTFGSVGADLLVLINAQIIRFTSFVIGFLLGYALL